MYKKTIKYTDYDGNPREEDYYFNLNKAEITKWLTTSGDYTLDKLLEKLSKERNGKEIMRIFEDLIYQSYGEKSVDGRRFIKTPEVKANFMETEAYSVLFMELATDAKAAAEFVSKVIPSDLSNEVQKLIDENPNGIPENLRDYIPSGGGPTQFPVK